MSTSVKRDHDDFFAFTRRILRALGRRVVDADEFELQEFVSLRFEMDRLIDEVVAGQRAAGRSWSYIGTALGISAAQAIEKYDPKVRATRLERDRLRAQQARSAASAAR